MKRPKKRPNIQLEYALYWEAKKMADAREITFSEFVSQAIQFFMPAKPKKPTHD